MKSFVRHRLLCDPLQNIGNFSISKNDPWPSWKSSYISLMCVEFDNLDRLWISLLSYLWVSLRERDGCYRTHFVHSIPFHAKVYHKRLLLTSLAHNCVRKLELLLSYIPIFYCISLFCWLRTLYMKYLRFGIWMIDPTGLMRTRNPRYSDNSRNLATEFYKQASWSHLSNLGNLTNATIILQVKSGSTWIRTHPGSHHDLL